MEELHLLPHIEALHLAGASPEINADELHLLNIIFFLGVGASPSFSLHILPLPQASSKKDELELHQASSIILQPLPVFHSSPMSSSPP
jgi:hypothetical protein